MSIYNNIDGVYKTVNNTKVNIDGTWRNISDTSNNIDGIWKSNNTEKFTIKFYVNRSLYKTITCIRGKTMTFPSCVSNNGVGWAPSSGAGEWQGGVYSPNQFITPTYDMLFSEVVETTILKEYQNIQKKMDSLFSVGGISSGYITGKNLTGTTSFRLQTQSSTTGKAYAAYPIDGGPSYLRPLTLGPDHDSTKVTLNADVNAGWVSVKSDSTCEIILHAYTYIYYTYGI